MLEIFFHTTHIITRKDCRRRKTFYDYYCLHFKKIKNMFIYNYSTMIQMFIVRDRYFNFHFFSILNYVYATHLKCAKDFLGKMLHRKMP